MQYVILALPRYFGLWSFLGLDPTGKICIVNEQMTIVKGQRDKTINNTAPSCQNFSTSDSTFNLKRA